MAKAKKKKDVLKFEEEPMEEEMSEDITETGSEDENL